MSENFLLRRGSQGKLQEEKCGRKEGKVRDKKYI